MMLVRAEAIRSLPVALAATAWFGHCPAQAAPASPVPDFYQHQAWLPATIGNAANVPAGMNGWAGWQAADYVPNGGKNAALNEAVENGKQGYCWYASIVDALYPWTQYRTSTGAAPFASLFGTADITMPGMGRRLRERHAGRDRRGPGERLRIDQRLPQFSQLRTDEEHRRGRADRHVFHRRRQRNGHGQARRQDGGDDVLPDRARRARLQQRLDRCGDDQGEPAAAADPLVDNQFPRHGDRRPRRRQPAPGRGSGLGSDQCRELQWWMVELCRHQGGDDAGRQNAAATASLNAAIAAVRANMYTNAQAAGATPVPGAPMPGVGRYTAANL